MIVSDGDLWTVTPVYVTVSDVNDNVPRFMEKTYRVTVPERPEQRRRSQLVKVGVRLLVDQSCLLAHIKYGSNMVDHPSVSGRPDIFLTTFLYGGKYDSHDSVGGRRGIEKKGE